MSKTKSRLNLTTLEAREVPAIVVPALSSKPDAPYTIYLDFDGAYAEEWGPWNNTYSPGEIPPFSIDADQANTSSEEWLAMGRVWHYVAEDYSPFNVNVTTVNFASGGSSVEDQSVRIIIGGSADDWLDEEAFGVAFIDDFFEDTHPKAFVFSEDIVTSIGNNSWLPKVIGDAASHEAGHTLGLEHQSQYQSISSSLHGQMNEYRPSAVNASTGEYRGVLMGNSYDARSTWSNGAYSQGSLVIGNLQTQDDMAILGSALGWRADEATRNLGLVAPGAPNRWAEGIIGKTGDSDAFQFVHHGGPLSLTVTTLFETTPAVLHAGNLDSRVTVTALGTAGAMSLGTFNPTSTLGVSTLVNVPATGSLHPSVGQFTGNYLLTVTSAGQYGDVGQYKVNLAYGPATTKLPSVQTSTAWVSTTSSGSSGGASGAITVKAAVQPKPSIAPPLSGGTNRAAITPVPIPPSRPLPISVVQAPVDEMLLPILHGVAL